MIACTRSSTNLKRLPPIRTNSKSRFAEEYGARKNESSKFAEMEELADKGRYLMAQYPNLQYECIMGIRAFVMGNYKLASDYGIKLLEEDERRAKADFLSAGVDIEISDTLH